MKTLYYSFVMSILLWGNLFGQTPQDPLQGHYNMGSSDELALFWRNSYDDTLVKHQIFDYYGNSGQYFIDSSARGIYSGDLGNSNDGKYFSNSFDAITGDFNGDGYDNIVAAWETTNNSINIVIPRNIDKKALSWNDQNVLRLTNVLYPNPHNYLTHRFKLVKGYFDGNPEPDFALAYWNTDGNIEIKIFDVDPNSLMPVEKDSIADVYMDPALNNSGIYDIAAGDFDGDGRDEIVLTYYTEMTDNDWHISTKIYDYVENNGSFTLVPKAEKDNFFTSNDFFDSYHHINDLLVATGDFKNNTLDQFVVDFVLYRSGSETYNELLPASVNMNLDTINVNLNNVNQIFQTLGEQNIAIDLTTGDINNDGKDEIVINGGGRLRIYNIDTTLNILNYVSANYGSSDLNRKNLILADLDASTADSVWNPEIIIASTLYYQPDNSSNYTTMSITVFEPTIDASDNIIALNKRASIVIDSTEGSGGYYWALTAGDFDGGGIRLGKPNYFSATKIVQPLVILNAPPTHFDVFNDTTFDINDSYNGQVSDFYSDYYTSSESEIEVESELHKGWSVGGSVEGGFSIPIVDIGVKVKIEGEYGKNFSKQTFDKTTYKVSQNIKASNDDYIYATIVDYDVWEYPIIANDTVKGYTLVVSPKQSQNAWFPSKSTQADEYIPDHEVGNILSYGEIASPSDNGSLQTAVKWNTSDAVTLDGSPGFEYQWSLENSTQTKTTDKEEVNWSVGASASFKIPFKFIPNFKLHGKYKQSTISTSTNTVTYTQGLDVHLGPIDLGIGEDYYSVQPYAYWSKSGALVLNYAVNPRPSDINVPETWWQQRYGNKTDPAFILPWRLDPEKGYNIPADKREQTKEIIFTPDNPNPGDVVNIQTRIHNFSLLNTSGPVNVRFYVGDPNNGGTLIQSTDNKTEFSTSDFIKARGSAIINFDWKLPDNLPFYPRIYAVIDPENQIDEIHEDNNIGWKVLSYNGQTTGVENKKDVVPVSFKLSQNYPNPFNPTTTIEYTIPQSRFVSLKVYDILGREVKTLVHQQELSGTYKVHFDGSNLASGVYFYRIEAGEFVATKKLLLLK